MKRRALLFTTLALGSLALGEGGAAGADGPSPPAGWEAPPPLAEKEAGPKSPKSKKPAAPVCCKFDSTCCSRQTTIDGFVRPKTRSAFEVRLADLPEAVVKEAAKDGPPVIGAPGPKITDDDGHAFPWLDGPKGYELHIVPPGRYGMIKTNGEYFADYFEPIEYRGMGAGELRTINHKIDDRGVGLLYVPIEFLSFAKGEGEKITVDEVKGKLEGSPLVKATFWMHAEAVNIAAGIVHGYRAPYEGEPRAVFILPEVVLGFDSKDAKLVGGFFRSRFSSTVPFTQYFLPLGPGRSGLVNGSIDSWQINRWFPRPKGAEKLPSAFQIVISTSQTSVEAEPRIKVMFIER